MAGSGKQSVRLGYQQGLDGLRAIAVVAVLLFHGGMKWLPGGFLGVDVFFVISGYLITGILMRNPGAGLVDFYWRRVRRLYPALLAMAIVTQTLAASLMRDAVGSTVRDLPWALTFLSNWWFVFHKVPYFEAMGRPPLFRHTWSLAVEFQFYLVWPVLVWLVFRRWGRGGVRWLALALAAGSTALLAVNGDATGRAYFGTDTHSMGIFLGAALATVGVSRSRKVADRLGLVALASLFALFHFVDEALASYRWGIPLASVCSLVLIAAAIVPGSGMGRWLATAPLRWLGTRSYSIYVWHWPIFQATRPGVDVTGNIWLSFLLRLVLTAGVAEASFRWIEEPIRAGWRPRWSRWAVAAVACGLVAMAVAETQLVRAALAAEKAPPVILAAPPKAPKPVATDAEREAMLQTPTLLLGDSVLLGVSQWLAQEVNVVKVDATVGRQVKELRARAESLAEEKELPPVVVLNLGNNGTVEEPTFRAILETLKPCKRVVVVNTRVPRAWQDADDDLIAKVVPEYPNAILADWRAASKDHPEYFGADGVHANVAGARAYTEVVVAALVTLPIPVDVAKPAAAVKP